MNSSSFFIQFALMMVVLLIVSFTDPTASSSFPKYSGSNNEFELLRAINPNQSIAYPSSSSSYSALGTVFSVAGFVGNLIAVYRFVDSFVNPAPDLKGKLNDLLNVMDTEFKQVKNTLDKMDKKLDQLLVQSYHEVEKSVSIALQDMNYGVSSDQLFDRPNKLHSQLDTFLKGMLGQGTILPDLLLNLRDLYDCGTRSMKKKMEEFITIVNVGVACLSYYNKAIKNFNGDARVRDLEKKYEAVKIRLEKETNTCAPTDSSTKIHEYINNILRPNQADAVSTWSITVLLYKRFGDVYPNHNWIFYAAWKFNPLPAGQIIDDRKKLSSYSIKHTVPSRGLHGVTKNGHWTVLWVGHAVLEGDNTNNLVVGEKAIINILDDSVPTPAYSIQNKIQQSSAFSGRTPVAYMVITNPPSGAEAGNPDHANHSRPLNIWKKRVRTIWKFWYEVSKDERYIIKLAHRVPIAIDVVIM